MSLKRGRTANGKCQAKTKAGGQCAAPPVREKTTAHYTQTSIEPPNSVAMAAFATARCTKARFVRSPSQNRPGMGYPPKLRMLSKEEPA
jgi:hypothetical protein